MNKSLGYLREAISNYTDRNEQSISIDYKLQNGSYQSERYFVDVLSDEEISFLNSVLPDEIRYAMDEKDYQRVHELNEVFEQLY
ncbi:sporulation protein [Bacillus lacus]|uniref:Sporulation protein n=1 Tax=Metabacillus lacus TaxID=1983721 RepID=A0A7X2IWC7_9BACI|nr:sporulation protein [Metabacillus lacus]MRX70950.1 sporulation protein [Metabacillus lacus]